MSKFSKFRLDRELNTIDSAILILLFIALAVKTFRKSRQRYLFGLSLIFLVSNCASLTCSLYPYFKLTLDYKKMWAFAVAQASLNSGHWWFCYRYLDCSICLPYNTKNEAIPCWINLAKSGLFYSLMAVQALSAPAYCIPIYQYTS